jgi:[acyl-carrier-protein] S-malonyltransferase
VAFHEPRVPLVANVSARAVTTAAEIRDGMARQLTSPVLWHASLATIMSGISDGAPPRAVLEVGPGKVLTNLAKRAYPATRLLTVGSADDLDKVLDSLAEALA